jgi:hypothetical protein
LEDRFQKGNGTGSTAFADSLLGKGVAMEEGHSLAKEERDGEELRANRQAVLRKPTGVILPRLRRKRPVLRAISTQGNESMLEGERTGKWKR